MNRLVLGIFLLGITPAALAIEPANDRTLSDSIADRLDALEKLTVTAEKPADANSSSDDAEVEALLAEALAAEAS